MLAEHCWNPPNQWSLTWRQRPDPSTTRPLGVVLSPDHPYMSQWCMVIRPYKVAASLADSARLIMPRAEMLQHELEVSPPLPLLFSHMTQTTQPDILMSDGRFVLRGIAANLCTHLSLRMPHASKTKLLQSWEPGFAALQLGHLIRTQPLESVVNSG